MFWFKFHAGRSFETRCPNFGSILGSFSFKNPQKQSISEKQNRPSKSIFGSILRATPCVYIYRLSISIYSCIFIYIYRWLLTRNPPTYLAWTHLLGAFEKYIPCSNPFTRGVWKKTKRKQKSGRALCAPEIVFCGVWATSPRPFPTCIGFFMSAFVLEHHFTLQISIFRNLGKLNVFKNGVTIKKGWFNNFHSFKQFLKSA